jgi:hypothetical protein
MDFIKRHFEKVIVIAVLVALIGLSGYLTWKTMGWQGGDTDTRRPGLKSDEPPLDLALYENTVRQMTQPALWKSDPNGMFRTENRKPPEQPPPPIGDTNKPPTVSIPPVYFERVEREVFNLMFMSYSWDEEMKKASNFQVNHDRRGITYFIDNVGDTIMGRLGDENTQCVITGFERIQTNVVRGSLPLTEDVSKLTVQVRDKPPITLIKGQPALWDEPVAWAGCQRRDAKDPKAIVKGKAERVRRGSNIVCGTNTYNVIDIKANQMIIVGPSKSETNVLTNVAPPENK